jgi:Uma2 family endonuclease
MTINQHIRPAATYADIEALPPNIVGQILFGKLVTHPRPSPRHAAASYSLSGELAGPFQKGQGGPGGWVFFSGPELHLGPHVVVPDLAGWRRERLKTYPETNYFELAPDWVCEVLSGSTERRDRTSKRRIYAEAGVESLWLIDPRFQLLEAFVQTNGLWLLIGTWGSNEVVSVPPFEAISIALGDLWPLDPPLGLGENPQHLFVGDR